MRNLRIMTKVKLENIFFFILKLDFHYLDDFTIYFLIYN